MYLAFGFFKSCSSYGHFYILKFTTVIPANFILDSRSVDDTTVQRELVSAARGRDRLGPHV